MTVADSRRVALMHANNDLATQLSDAVNTHVPGWTADAHAAVVDSQSRGEKLTRAKNVFRGDYDLVQADELVGNGPAAQAIAWASNTPVVGYLRGWGDYTNDHGQYGWVLRNRIRFKTSVLTRSMDGLAAISNALVGGMVGMYPMGDCRVIERPYDVEYYAGGRDDVFDRPTILTTTNLRYKEKFDGVKTILKGLENVLWVHDDYQYAIAGGGQYLDAVRDEVEAHPRSDQIRVLGYRDDVPDLLASADVFAYVSFLDGAPSTVYEAQAAGLPVVAGDAAGVPEATGDAGVIAPPTPNGIHESVSALLSDDALRRQYAAAAEEKMQSHNERVAHDWVAWWSEVLAE